MKIKDNNQAINIEEMPYNACSRCWNGFSINNREVKKGQYSEFAVYIHYKDKPNELLCYKCLCTTCGHIKLWGNINSKNKGYFYQRLNGSNLINLDIRNWFIVKKLNLDPSRLEDLLLANPRKNHFTLQELPKLVDNDISSLDVSVVPV